ncbi:unnamed protein product [Protopolystoma xenopodis]|uniref:Uncharacterized protein n=1 Tax=Protopolystoma xenopodis TaxID=117903 RepID=A0A448WB38_9PLAT|nr:unnamed protein product [Protopolystoma xenopodis]
MRDLAFAYELIGFFLIAVQSGEMHIFGQSTEAPTFNSITSVGSISAGGISSATSTAGVKGAGVGNYSRGHQNALSHHYHNHRNHHYQHSLSQTGNRTQQHLRIPFVHNYLSGQPRLGTGSKPNSDVPISLGIQSHVPLSIGLNCNTDFKSNLSTWPQAESPSSLPTGSLNHPATSSEHLVSISPVIGHSIASSIHLAADGSIPIAHEDLDKDEERVPSISSIAETAEAASRLPTSTNDLPLYSSDPSTPNEVPPVAHYPVFHCPSRITPRVTPSSGLHADCRDLDRLIANLESTVHCNLSQQLDVSPARSSECNLLESQDIDQYSRNIEIDAISEFDGVNIPSAISRTDVINAYIMPHHTPIESGDNQSLYDLPLESALSDPSFKSHLVAVSCPYSGKPPELTQPSLETSIGSSNDTRSVYIHTTSTTKTHHPSEQLVFKHSSDRPPILSLSPISVHRRISSLGPNSSVGRSISPESTCNPYSAIPHKSIPVKCMPASLLGEEFEPTVAHFFAPTQSSLAFSSSSPAPPKVSSASSTSSFNPHSSEKFIDPLDKSATIARTSSPSSFCVTRRAHLASLDLIDLTERLSFTSGTKKGLHPESSFLGQSIRSTVSPCSTSNSRVDPDDLRPISGSIPISPRSDRLVSLASWEVSSNHNSLQSSAPIRTHSPSIPQGNNITAANSTTPTTITSSATIVLVTQGQTGHHSEALCSSSSGICTSTYRTHLSCPHTVLSGSLLHGHSLHKKEDEFDSTGLIA